MAKKIKPVKKAAISKKVLKKLAPKKAEAKKTIFQKVSVKRATTKKAVVKKGLLKKGTVKKAALNAMTKKALIKNVVPKKPIVKKSAVNDTTKKAVVKKPMESKEFFAKPVTKLIEANKNTVAKLKNTAPSSSQATTGRSNELVIKAANTKTDKPITADGLSIAQKTGSTFDKNVFNTATERGDLHSKLHLSKAKNTLKPSGKKPLW